MATKKTKTTKTVKKATVKEETKNATPEEELLCEWKISNTCKGKIQKQYMFDKQLFVPLCEGHMKEHRDVMFLYKNGYDIEEVLNMSPEDRRREALTLGLSLSTTEDVSA